MMNTNNHHTSCCSVCLEQFDRGAHLPLSLTPCGHVACKACLATWLASHGTCPECRQQVTGQVPNRALMDVLEATVVPEPEPLTTVTDRADNQRIQAPAVQGPAVSVGRIAAAAATNVSAPAATRLFEVVAGSQQPRQEVLQDKCHEAFYIIDNSGSMNNGDGKIFECRRSDGHVTQRSNITRWQEAGSKTLQIAQYNVQRNMRASYYLLNPTRSSRWECGTDFITVDPTSDQVQQQLTALERLLLPRNVCGGTPLHKIAAHFNRELLQLRAPTMNSREATVNFNVITDGQPDNKALFERELRNLAQNHNIFLTVNLCTDNQEVIAYYNELDTALGTEVSGMDVIDDMLGEMEEIEQAGNTFFVYSHHIHVARMAGCFNAAADLVDEEQLSLHCTLQLVCEVLGSPEVLVRAMQHDTQQQFLGLADNINSAAGSVYDLKTRRMQKPIIMKQLRRATAPSVRSRVQLQVSNTIASNPALSASLVAGVVVAVFTIFGNDCVEGGLSLCNCMRASGVCGSSAMIWVLSMKLFCTTSSEVTSAPTFNAVVKTLWRVAKWVWKFTMGIFKLFGMLWKLVHWMWSLVQWTIFGLVVCSTIMVFSGRVPCIMSACEWAFWALRLTL